MLRPLGIFFLSRVALIAAVLITRPFLVLPTPRPDPSCVLGICEPNGWVPLILAAIAMAAAVSVLWLSVRRDDGADAASAAVLLFLASPLSLVLTLDAAAALATACSLLALFLARSYVWASGLVLAAATLFVPASAAMIPAVVFTAWASDVRGMRVNAILVALPAAVMLAFGSISVPWLQVAGLTSAAPGFFVHQAAIGIVLVACVVAVASGRSLAGLAGASWLAAGFALQAPAAAHLAASAAAPWGAVATVARRWQIEALVAGSLFALQGLWLFHLMHGFKLL